jgi:hypothetical protein
MPIYNMEAGLGSWLLIYTQQTTYKIGGNITLIAGTGNFVITGFGITFKQEKWPVIGPPFPSTSWRGESIGFPLTAQNLEPFFIQVAGSPLDTAVFLTVGDDPSFWSKKTPPSSNWTTIEPVR